MRVELSHNPLVLSNKDVVVYDVFGSLTPNQIIERESLIFSRPFILLVDGRPVGRALWNLPVQEGAVLRFVVLPQGGGGGSNPLRIIAMIAIVAVAGWAAGALGGGMLGAVGSAAVMGVGSMLVNAMFPAQKPSPLDAGQQKTVYDISTDNNQLRIGAPFAEHFGRMICFPDLVQRPYTSYEDSGSETTLTYLENLQYALTLVTIPHESGQSITQTVQSTDAGFGDAYFYMLGIIGVGEYDIEGVYVDDTPMSAYAGSAYNIIAPGESPALVPRLCWSCDTYSGQELTTDWLPAVLTTSGTAGTDIEYDIVFPSGLAQFNDDGSKRHAVVTIETEVRTVDDAGNATSDWTTLTSKTYSNATIEALRFSHRLAAPLGEGRYEFRVRRTNEQSRQSRTIDRVQITGARVYGGDHPDYGNVTMFECRVRASDTLNGAIANRINVVATRKLHAVTATGFATDKTASRSIVDAVAYVVTTENGGRQDAGILDWAALAELRNTLEAANYHYDWRHTTVSSVMEVCKKMAALARAIPYTPGGLFTLIQDKKQALPAVKYTEDDYTAGSLNLSHNIQTNDTPTCIEIVYTDPDTWKDERIMVFDVNGSAQHPYTVDLEGCTNRQHAYEIAWYRYKDEMLNRTAVEFETGLQGHLPQPGAKLLLSSNMIDWGQTGKVLDIDGTQWLLSEPVRFNGEPEGQLFITGTNGAALGPIPVTPTSHARVVEGPVPASTKTIKDDGMIGAAYLFGPASEELCYIRLLAVRPRGQDKITIIGDIIHDEVYDPPGEAPAKGELPSLAVNLAFVNLQYTGESGADYAFYCTWAGGASAFRIEADYQDGNGYILVADNHTSSNVTITSSSTSVAVKVTPYVGGTLYTSEAITKTLSLLVAPALDVVVTETNVSLSWTAVTGATGYSVTLLDMEGNDKGAEYTTATIMSKSIADLAAAGVGNTFDFKLEVIGDADAVAPSIVSVTLPVLAAPADFSLVDRLAGGVSLAWSTVSGATGYAIWRGDAVDFTPGNDNLVAVASSTSTTVACDMSTGYHHYFKLGATNAIYDADTPSLLAMSSLEVTE